jgi:hypothetical protein
MKALLAITAAASLLMGCATSQQHTRAWEYETVYGKVVGKAHGDQISLADAINREVAQGWQFVSSSGAGENWGFAVLKREKKLESASKTANKSNTAIVLPPGGAGTFTETPAGTTPLAYQWRFNGTNAPPANNR